MRKIESTRAFQQDQMRGMQLEGNHNVTRVIVHFSLPISGEIVVKYAQNGIITDLIDFGEHKVAEVTEAEIKAEIPASASHIYVLSPQENVISEIEIYETQDCYEMECYPAYRDLDLKENYYLDTVSVFTGQEGYTHYTVYTSMDGKNFDLLAVKSSNDLCDSKTGDIYDAKGKEARIIRVYIEYYSASVEAVLDDICYTGRKSNTPVCYRPEIEIPTFQDSVYNVEITPEDTYQEIYGIIARRLGACYQTWFTLELAENAKNGYDYFELSSDAGTIHIKGNNGVSLAVGLNHYLKYICKVNISQVGDQVKMPSAVIPLPNRIYRETKAKMRYSYNYCTLSYSMAFWGEKEWRDELDWLALNGVNLVLDATAQEEVFRRFLSGLGYTHDEIKKYIAGPAYYAWAYMANLYGYGGPVHDSWFSERTELARKNHLIMRKLGMYPVLQGYSGMVPIDINEHDSNVKTIPQGTWCSFTRPLMLQTTAPVFREYARKFYQAQQEVYGSYSIYYATDPFHEGGNIGSMSMKEISAGVLQAMLESDPEAVWIIQSWQQNPTSELLVGLDAVENGKAHALILDLYAEKLPNYGKGHAGSYAFGYSEEFDHTPWLFCMLNNFGGRLGMHGHLDHLASWIPKAYNSCNHIAGIGITPEASVNNPVLYDFFFECIWVADADLAMEEIDLNSWLCEYSHRRYGVKSETAAKAWGILKETVYKGELNLLGQGAPESVLNARPSLKINAASTWGNAMISYDKSELEKAAALLLEDYHLMKESDGYIYDVTTILQQVLSNRAQDCYKEMVTYYNEKQCENFETSAEKFLTIADEMEQVTGSNRYYMLGRWVEQAKALAANADDFSKKLYEFNAKALVTTWGAYNQAEIGQLHDYSNRQWSGLIGDFYKPRWERWIQERIKELKNQPYEEKIPWFEWEWKWAREDTVYPTEPAAVNLLEVGHRILSK